MRLLHTEESHTGNFEIIEFTDDRIPPYAILSHTWEGGEVTFQDMHADQLHTRQKKGYSKIQRCCHLAKAEGFEYVWIDSCCIDKTSSAELSEAINSMYRWYQEAEVCYAYLADVPFKEFKESKWFTRGWTLQELIAPTKITFLDENWKGLGSKADLQQAISECTRIPIGVLSGDKDIESFSIAQRMSWAAERVTTRVEDRAYSLLGIFGVNIPLIYGERETAFIRLQEEIMRISDDHSLFAWRSPDNRGGLLATSPAAFIGSHNIVRFNPFDAFNVPFAATSTGIDLRVRFMGVGPRGLGLAILHCKEEGEGDRLVALYVRDSEFLTMERFERVHSEDFRPLDLRKYRPSQYPMRQMIIQAGRLRRHWKSKDCGKCDGINPEIYSDAELMTLMEFEKPSALLRAVRRGLEDIVWLLLTRSDVEGDRRGPGGLTPLMHASRKGHETIAKILVARHDVTADSTDDEGRTPLWWAAQAGHEAIVKMLVEKSIAIEVRDRVGWTPLIIACKNEHEGTVEVLLDKGAAIEAQGLRGHTPLLAAVWRGYKVIVKVLLDKGADIEVQDSQGDTPLLAALRRGYEAIFKVLLDKGAAIEAQDPGGNTPLLVATQKGYEVIVKVLLDKGADIEVQDSQGDTPLLAATQRGYEAIVSVLLEKGANIEAQDPGGNTPLLVATRRGYEAIVSVLLGKGADIEVQDSQGDTPLLAATERGYKAIVSMLLDKDINTEIQDQKGRTPLLLAAWGGYENTVRALLERGAVVEVRDREGWTPLLRAAFGGHEAVGRVLLENGADIETRHPNGLNSLLYCSAWHARDTFAKMLLENGANIEARDKQDETALFLAVRKGHIAIVKLLLQHGAEANIRNCSGRTPMAIAKSEGQKAIVELLRASSHAYRNSLSTAVGRFLAPKPPNRGL